MTNRELRLSFCANNLYGELGMAELIFAHSRIPWLILCKFAPCRREIGQKFLLDFLPARHLSKEKCGKSYVARRKTGLLRAAI